MPALKNAKHERFYVYTLVDPRDGGVFYVGKGCGRRYADHLKEWRAGRVVNAGKHQRIGEIVRGGHSVEVRLIASGLTERAAFALERERIKAIGRDNLTNLLRGQQSEMEKGAVIAADWLRRVKPFEDWATERRPTLCEMALYAGVVDDLRQMADYPNS